MNLLAIMHQALESRLGLVIPTNNPKKLRQDFYTVRRAQTYEIPLKFSIGPCNAKLYLIKESANVTPTSSGE